METPSAPKVPEGAKSAAKAPGKAAKGIMGKLKGQPKWVYVAGAVVLIGFAYLALRRDPDEAIDEELTDEEAYGADTLGEVAGDYADYGASGGGGGDYGTLYPAPTQGSYGGESTPDYVEDAPDDAPDATVLVEFGAAPVTVKNKNRKPKQKAHPTGGGKHPNRNSRDHFHPKDERAKHNRIRGEAKQQHKDEVRRAKGLPKLPKPGQGKNTKFNPPTPQGRAQGHQPARPHGGNNTPPRSRPTAKAVKQKVGGGGGGKKKKP